MPTDEFLSSLKATLLEERERLARQVEELGEGEEGTAAFDENFADSGQVAAEQGENRSLASSLQDQLDDVEHALSKFELGTYGICEVSGEPIPESRLEAMPATRTLVECA